MSSETVSTELITQAILDDLPSAPWFEVARGESQSGSNSGEVTVDTMTSSEVPLVDVAILSDGSHLVVWYKQQLDAPGIWAERLDVDGEPIGQPIQIGNVASGRESSLNRPHVASIDAGGSVIVWADATGLRGVMIPSTDLTDAIPFGVTSEPSQVFDGIAATGTGDGGFAVSWISATDHTIYLQRFHADASTNGDVLSVYQSPATTSLFELVVHERPGNAVGVNWTEVNSEFTSGGTKQLRYADVQQDEILRLVTIGHSTSDVLLADLVVHTDDRFATVGTTFDSAGIHYVLQLWDEQGVLGESRVIGSSASSISSITPQIAFSDAFGFVVTFAVDGGEFPTLVSQYFNLDAVAIGEPMALGSSPDRQANFLTTAVGDSLQSVASWISVDFDSNNVYVVSSTQRLDGTRLSIDVNEDYLDSAGNVPDGLVRVNGLDDIPWSHGTAGPEGTWLLPSIDDYTIWLVSPAVPQQLALTLNVVATPSDPEPLVSESLLLGTPGDDRIEVGGNLQYVNGGDGDDTIVLPGLRAEYELYSAPFADIVASRDGVSLYFLHDIETVRFANISLPLWWLQDDTVPPMQDSFSTTEDGTIIPNNGGLLLYDRPAHGTPREIVVLDEPTTGTLSWTSDGNFTFVPPTDFSGTSTFVVATQPKFYTGGELVGGGLLHATADDLPAIEFESIPLPLIVGRHYRVEVQFDTIHAIDGDLVLTYLDGNPLIPSQSAVATLNDLSYTLVDFEFQMSEDDDGLAFVFQPGAPNATVDAWIKRISIIDTETEDTVVTTGLVDFEPQVISLTVVPVADTPILTVDAQLVPGTATTVVHIESHPTDNDGSEYVLVSIESLPEGTTVTDDLNLFVAGNGFSSIDVTTWNLQTLKITLPDQYDAAYIHVVSLSVELANGSSQTVTVPAYLGRDDRSTPPAPGITLPPGAYVAPPTSGIVPPFGGTVPNVGYGTSGGSANSNGTSNVGNNVGSGANTPHSGNAATTPSGSGSSGGPSGGDGANNAPEGDAQPQGNVPGGDVPPGQSDKPSAEQPNDDKSPPAPGDPSAGPVGSEFPAPLLPDDTLQSSSSRSSAQLRDLAPVWDEDEPEPAGPGGPRNEARHSDNQHGITAHRPFAIASTSDVKASFDVAHLWHDMDEVSEEVQQTMATPTVIAGTAVVVAMGFSSVQIAWLLRGSLLVSRLLSSMPLWFSFDPLPILSAAPTALGAKRTYMHESLADIASGWRERKGT